MLGGWLYSFDAPAGRRGVIYTAPANPDVTTPLVWTQRYIDGAINTHRQALAYDDTTGTYVAIGRGGVILRSTDGAVTWTSFSSPVTTDLKDIAFGDGVFVAGCGDFSVEDLPEEVVITSPDGLTWTKRATEMDDIDYVQLETVDYIAGRFNVSGWNTRIYESEDGGVSFQTRLSTHRQIFGFSEGNGVQLGVGFEGNNGDDVDMISTNGLDWTPIDPGAVEDRTAITFFNGTFITVGDNGSIRQSGTVMSPAGGYGSWAEVHFPEAPPLSDPGDDFDGDGWSNLAEYVAGTDPRDAGDVPEVTLADDGAMLTMTMSKDASVSDVLVGFETSTTLLSGEWTDLGITVVDDGDRVHASVPVDEPRRFLRAVFSLLE